MVDAVCCNEFLFPFLSLRPHGPTGPLSSPRKPPIRNRVMKTAAENEASLDRFGRLRCCPPVVLGLFQSRLVMIWFAIFTVPWTHFLPPSSVCVCVCVSLGRRETNKDTPATRQGSRKLFIRLFASGLEQMMMMLMGWNSPYAYQNPLHSHFGSTGSFF